MNRTQIIHISISQESDEWAISHVQNKAISYLFFLLNTFVEVA